MPPPNATLAISITSIAERYGQDFAALVIKASGCSGQSGYVWMAAQDYTQLLIEWATDGEGPKDGASGEGEATNTDSGNG